MIRFIQITQIKESPSKTRSFVSQEVYKRIANFLVDILVHIHTSVRDIFDFDLILIFCLAIFDF